MKRKALSLTILALTSLLALLTSCERHTCYFSLEVSDIEYGSELINQTETDLLNRYVAQLDSIYSIALGFEEYAYVEGDYQELSAMYQSRFDNVLPPAAPAFSDEFKYKFTIDLRGPSLLR